jgi:hypothetical protein
MATTEDIELQKDYDNFLKTHNKNMEHIRRIVFIAGGSLMIIYVILCIIFPNIGRF